MTSMAEEEPPWKKQKTNLPPSPSFLSLPDVIITNCLARVSRSYYPKLSLVCKTFRSLILTVNSELYKARFHLKTQEFSIHLRLHMPNHTHPAWFSLWIKPDQTLTNDLDKKKKSKGHTRLVRAPSSYFNCVPLFMVSVGSELYGLRQSHPPSTVMFVRNKEMYSWRQAPNMKVARESAVACVLDGKIYVMGGCNADVTIGWCEVFDTKTQIWESLPDPGVEIRSCSIKTIEVSKGKIYIRSNEKKDYVYDPVTSGWEDVVKQLGVWYLMVNKVLYRCTKENFSWYDKKYNEWKVVRGLAKLHKNCCRGVIEVINHGEKLLILWDKFAQPRKAEEKKIWCAVIEFETRKNDVVWGNVEWANVVLTVPSSYSFLRRLVSGI